MLRWSLRGSQRGLAQLLIRLTRLARSGKAKRSHEWLRMTLVDTRLRAETPAGGCVAQERSKAAERQRRRSLPGASSQLTPSETGRQSVMSSARLARSFVCCRSVPATVIGRREPLTSDGNVEETARGADRRERVAGSLSPGGGLHGHRSRCFLSPLLFKNSRANLVTARPGY